MFDGQTGLAQFAVIARCGVTGFDGAHIQIVCQFKRQAGAVVGNFDVAIVIAEVYFRTWSHVGGSATLGAHIPTTISGGIGRIQSVLYGGISGAVNVQTCNDSTGAGVKAAVAAQSIGGAVAHCIQLAAINGIV